MERFVQNRLRFIRKEAPEVAMQSADNIVRWMGETRYYPIMRLGSLEMREAINRL
jgi:hypothetical protein